MGGKACRHNRLFYSPTEALNLKPLLWRSSIMLLVVLCSFSPSVVKQNLKFLFLSTYRKWWIATPEYVTAFLRSNYYDGSKFGRTLTKVIASCFSRKIVVNFCQEIFLTQSNFVTSKTKALRIDCFKVCLAITTSLIKGLPSSTLEQGLASSTIAGNFGLLAQRNFLPVFV